MAHTPSEELERKIKLGQKEVSVGSLYYHHKDPKTKYKIISVGLAEWSEEVVVVYQNVKNNIIWVRKLEGKDGWLTPVDRDGDDKSRFVLSSK